MPYNVLKKIEADETLTTCQQWNAEVCYGQGLQYDTCECTEATKLSFEAFLILENLYQGYLVTKDTALLSEMAAHLYQSKEPIHLADEEAVSIFYWYGSAKQVLARRYKHFFVTAEEASSEAMQERLQQQMNNQIRALTKGDITKEAQVLRMDVHRALVELDAQAREYEELKRETAKS